MAVVEHALLHVAPGRAADFERALAAARPLIEDTDGFLAMSVRPSASVDGQYLLLVVWRDIDAHTVNFRQSERYAHWCKLLHGFYESMPEVQYFKEPLT